MYQPEWRQFSIFDDVKDIYSARAPIPVQKDPKATVGAANTTTMTTTAPTATATSAAEREALEATLPSSTYPLSTIVRGYAASCTIPVFWFAILLTLRLNIL